MRHLIQDIGPAFALAVAALWLLQISLISALITTLAVAVIMQTGRALAATSGFGEVGLGVGFVVGVGIFVFSGQAFLLAGIPAYVAHWSVLAAMVAVAALISRQRAAADFTDHPSVGAEALFALSIALIVLSMRHPWVFPFAIPVAILERYRHHTQHQVVLRLVSASLIPVGWLVASAWRPDRWWYFYQINDAQLFEALGWSLARWGIFEHPGFVGGSIAEYHWLSYAFFGSLSHIGLLGPWDALMKLGGPLLAFAFAGIFVSGMKQELPRLLTPQWLVLVLAVWVMPTSKVDSFAFSLLVAMGFFIVLDKHTGGKQVISRVIFLLLVSLTLIFAKTSTAAVVAACLGLLLLVQFLRREKTNYTAAFCLASSLVVLYLMAWRSSAAESVLAISAPDFKEGLITLRNILDQPVFVTQFFLWAASILIFRQQRKVPSSLTLSLVIVAALALAFGLADVIPTVMEYFALPGLFFVTFLMARLWVGKSNAAEAVANLNFPPLAVMLGIVGLTGGFVLKFVTNRADAQFNVKSWVGDYFWEIIAGTGYLFVIGLVILILIIVIPRKKSQLVALSLVLVLSFNIGVTSDYARRISNYGASSYTNWDGNSAAFPTQELVLLGDHVRNSTATDQILASNNFCCAGTDWWSVIAAGLDDRPLTETSWGGANYLLAAETQRRYLVQGLRFLVGFQTATPEQINRMSLSLEFANTPSASSLRRLKAYGVSGYVVNLSLTEHRDWSEFAIERFQSGNFVYLELR